MAPLLCLINRKTQDSNAAISLEGTIISDKKKVANQLNRQFTPHTTTVCKDMRQLRRYLQKLPHSSMQFTKKEVNLAIRSTKTSKALGSDNIAPIMLRHLGPISIAYVTRL